MNAEGWWYSPISRSTTLPPSSHRSPSSAQSSAHVCNITLYIYIYIYIYIICATNRSSSVQLTFILTLQANVQEFTMSQLNILVHTLRCLKHCWYAQRSGNCLGFHNNPSDDTEKLLLFRFKIRSRLGSKPGYFNIFKLTTRWQQNFGKECILKHNNFRIISLIIIKSN